MREMELSEFAREYLLDEKLFIVPTRRIGLLMINNIAKKGMSMLNLNPITIRRLSEEICGQYIWENNILYIDEVIGKSIILDCLKTLESENKDFFFKKDLIDEKTAEEVYRVIMELKSKGILSFPKEKDLDKIYKSYTLKLKEFNAMDFCDIIEKAISLDELSKYKGKVIGVAENIEFNNLEKKLFKVLNENIVKIKMPVEKLVDLPKEYFFKGKANNLKPNRDVCFFSGFGIRNEIKYIINHILKNEIPLDEVVVSYTDKKYAEEIDLEFKKNGLSINLGDGLDILKSTTYRFIKTIFDFAKNYYNITEIRPIFFNGSLDIGKTKEKLQNISSESMYEDLTKSGVFYGRGSYEKLNLRAKEIDDSRRIKNEWLREFFKDLLGSLPTGGIEFGVYAGLLIELINNYVRVWSPYDKKAMEAIIEKLKIIQQIPLVVTKEEYFGMVLSYIEDININRSSVSPSKAFACKYTSAGYTGRKHLYLIGLDSDTVASKTVESPILLDSLRRDISPDLSFSKESYKYKKYKIKESLSTPFETICIGYSNFDMVNVKAKTPSKIYTELKAEYENKIPAARDESRLMAKDLVTSGTSLETLAQCSRKLYLKNRLYLEEKDEVEVNLDRWLDPLQRGILIHEILNLFFDLEESKRTDGKLLNIIQERSNLLKKEIPPILEEVYIREIEGIESFCKSIVGRQRDSGLEVFINELGFGTGKANKIFGPLQAQKIIIGDSSLSIRGSIDRIDIDRERKIFKIIDYKTGKLKNFDNRLRKSRGRGKNKVHDYNEGQKLQFFIYLRALENIISKNKDFKDYTIGNFSYEFEEDSIDLKLNNEFIEIIEARIIELLNIDIFENDKQIIYDKDDIMTCRYCEFENICKADSEEAYTEDGEF